MLYWTIVELILRVIIVGSNNILLDQETQLQYATFESLHNKQYNHYQEILKSIIVRQQSARYEVNIVGSKVLKTIDLRFPTLDLRF